MAWKACIVFAVVVTTAACQHQSAPATGTELQKVQAGDLDVVLLAPASSLKQGEDDAFTLEFRRTGSNTLVDVGTVKVSATMPMAGMPPMMANASAMPTGTAGRYTVNSPLTMSGTWSIGVEWEGPAGSGSAKLSANAQ